MKNFTYLKKMRSLLKELCQFITALLKGLWSIITFIVFVTVILVIYLMCTYTLKVGELTPRYQIYKYEIIESYRIKDKYNDKWVSGLLASIDKRVDGDSLIRFSKTNLWGHNKRYGFIDARTARVVIEPIFHTAGVFSKGYAAVAKGDKSGFIDHSGNFITLFNGDISNIEDVVVEDKYAIVQSNEISEQNSYGVISINGKWVLEPKYNEIKRSIHGRYIVELDGKYGLWCAEIGWIVEPKYSMIELYNYNDGFRIVDDGRSYVIDENGNIIKPFVFSFSEPLTYSATGDNDELCRTSDYLLFGLDEKCLGVYNVRTNRIVLPAKYTSVYMVAKDTFVVEENLDVEYLVDKNGNMIEPININVN